MREAGRKGGCKGGKKCRKRGRKEKEEESREGGMAKSLLFLSRKTALGTEHENN